MVMIELIISTGWRFARLRGFRTVRIKGFLHYYDDGGSGAQSCQIEDRRRANERLG